MIRDDLQPLRAIGTYTRRSGTGILIETYHDGYEVNETGAAIWSLIGSGNTILDIADSIADRFSVDREQALEAVRPFVAQLLERGFVVAEPEPDSSDTRAV